MLVCDKCSASIPQSAKFCAQCGDPVTEEDLVATPTSTQEGTATITFGESSSARYSRAIEICKNIPTFSTTGSGKNKEHKVALPLTEIELISNIFDLVGSWKSSSMMINGRSATKKDLTYHGLGCFRSQQRAYQPQQYCFGEREFEANIWGCKRLNMPLWQWGGGWLDYGSFDSSGSWVFDKGKIRHSLNLAISEIDLCPALNREMIFKTLEALPDAINPKTDTRWEYRSEYREIDGEYKEVAVGIRPVRDSGNLFVLGNYKPAWDFKEDSENSAHTIKVDLSSALDETDQRARKKTKVTWKSVAIAALAIYLFAKTIG